MDIESALKTIGDWISKETESRKYPKGELLEISESLQTLKTEIARQSVKSEEVAEAIDWATEELNDSIRYQHNYKAGCLDTIITALQAYQPKEPCSECIKYQNDFNYCADCGRKLGD